MERGRLKVQKCSEETGRQNEIKFKSRTHDLEKGGFWRFFFLGGNGENCNTPIDFS